MLEQAVASTNLVEEDAEAKIDRTTNPTEGMKGKTLDKVIAAFNYFLKRDNIHKQVDTSPSQIQGLRTVISSRKN